MVVCDEDATLELAVKTVRYFKSIEKVARERGYEQVLPAELRVHPASPTSPASSGRDSVVVVDAVQSPTVLRPQLVTPALLRANSPALDPNVRAVSPDLDLVPDRMASRIPEPALTRRLTPNPEQQMPGLRMNAVGA
ncbi:hypothetical protein HYQ44_008528 [Verticillium longisporum]|nr:hypothetical protein HYQ44_008528 [Verticillium longisporum]